MGSTAKTSKNVSMSESEETTESEVQTTEPKRKNTKKSGFLEAFDTPVPLVIPPQETRTLKVRNCGTNDIDMKISIQNGEGNDDARAFEIHPSEATVQPNDVFLIRVTYNAVEEKFDPDADKQKKKTRGKAAKTPPVNKQTKKPAIVEIIVGNEDFFYMYPILGSDDPKDEALAMQKHINLSQTVESDEEVEIEEAPKTKRKSKESSSSVPPKKHPKLDKEVTVLLTRTRFPLRSRSRIPNAVIKEESEENIEIKDEPLH